MGNINRDCIIELLLEQPQYNKCFEILPGKPLQFFKHDRNQTIYIIVKGNWNKELTLKMAIKNTETKHIIEYYPVLKGVEGDTHIFKVALSNEDILAIPGKYEFQFFILNGSGATKTVLSSNISDFKVKTCL